MKIALIQQQPTADLARNTQRGLAALEAAATAGADLVVYPELAFTPFYPQHRAGPNALDLAEPIPGPTTDVFQEAARRGQAGPCHAERNTTRALNQVQHRLRD